MLIALFFLSCNKEETKHSTPDASTRLQVKNITLEQAREKRFFNFNHENDTLKSIIISTSRSRYERALLYDYQDGKLQRIRHTPIGKAIDYQYENGKLKQIHHYEKAQTRSFNYDINGRVKEELIHFNRRLFLIIRYHYQDEKTIIVSHLDASETLLKQYLVRLSYLANIFSNLGPDLNLTENILGHTIGNQRYLPMSIEEVTQAHGDPKLLHQFSYTYNRYYYPLIISNHNQWTIKYKPLID